MIDNIEDLRGKRACFPEYDGVAWNSVISKLREKGLLNKCSYDEALNDFFGDICVGSNEALPEIFKNKCANELYQGDFGALQCLNHDIGDVAFVSKNNLEKFKEGNE